MNNADSLFAGLFKPFGPKRIFRPRAAMAGLLHDEAKFLLGKRFRPGTYEGVVEVNPIIQELFNFYDTRLRKLAPVLACRDLVDFLLFQYDEASEILHGNGISNPNEFREWREVEPLFRRAIKYAVELLCIQRRSSGPVIRRDLVTTGTEILLECAECAADLAEDSNRFHWLFPNDCRIEIHGDATPQAFTSAVTGEHKEYDFRFVERVAKDRANRERFIGPEPQFDVHTDRHAEFLNAPFEKTFGMSYAEFIAGIAVTIDEAKAAGEGHFPTLFIRRGTLVRELAKSGRSMDAIDVMLKGFTVSADHLDREKRVLWNAKQSSRAYRRGFFSFPHRSGEHLAFSRAMAIEAMIHLVSAVCFQKVPQEWDGPLIRRGLAGLSNAAGEWFEQIVTRNLRSVGYEGGHAKGWLGRGEDRITVPSDVGEIDFLGYHRERHEILLAEAKMTHTGLEGQIWRDDIEQFVKSPRSYAHRFRLKRDWVVGNLDSIRKLLNAPSDTGFDARMLTLYPCIASEFISDFPCDSITEFMLARTD